MGATIETFISDNVAGIAGNDMYIGLLIIAMFFGISLVSGSRLDAKLMILVPAVLLASAFLPILKFLFVVIGGGILWMAMTRLLNR